MENTKEVVIKGIHISSVFNFFGGTFLIAGLVIGLLGNLLKLDIMSIYIIRIFPFIEKLSPGIFTGIIFGIVYGLCAGVGFSILALLYNFFAALIGGIKVTTK